MKTKVAHGCYGFLGLQAKIIVGLGGFTALTAFNNIEF